MESNVSLELHAGILFHEIDIGHSCRDEWQLQGDITFHLNQESGYFVAALIVAAMGHKQPEQLPNCDELFKEHNDSIKKFIASKRRKGKRYLELAELKPEEQKAIHAFAWDFIDNNPINE